MGRRTKTSKVSRQNNDSALLAAEDILRSVVDSPKNTQLCVTQDVQFHSNNCDDTFVQDTLRTLRDRLKE